MIGPKLDLKNLKVDEFTSVEPVTVSLGTSTMEASRLMEAHNIRHLPVLENGCPVGIVSKRDISILECDLADLPVEEIMTPDPFTVRSTDLLKDVVFEMSSRKIGSVLVNDEDDKLYGIFTSIDALNSIIELF